MNKSIEKSINILNTYKYLFNNEEIGSYNSADSTFLSDIIDESKVGDKLRILANRNGEKVVADVTLGEANAE